MDELPDEIQESIDCCNDMPLHSRAQVFLYGLVPRPDGEHTDYPDHGRDYGCCEVINERSAAHTTARLRVQLR